MGILNCKECGTKNEYPDGAPGFMMTFGDMNTLLLTFFVLMITMSTFDIKKFNLVISSFKGTLGLLEGGEIIKKAKLTDMGIKTEDIDQKSFEPVIAFKDEETAELIEKIKQAIDIGKIEVKEQEEGLVIQITDRILFAPGSAQIRTAEAQDVLAKIGNLLRDIKELRDRPIRVEGHTDDLSVPASSENFNSNWELSVIRAVNVVKFLATQGKINPARMSAAGYGEYRPIAPNKVYKDIKTGEMVDGRAKNRRVDIVVLKKLSKKVK